MAVLPIVRRRLPAARLPFEDWRVIAATGVTLARAGPAPPHRQRIAAESAVQAIRRPAALVALRDRDLAAYHGVEHKAIGAYEHARMTRQCSQGAPALRLEPDRSDDAALGGGTVLLERLVNDPGPIARGGVSLGGVGAAVEMFVWSDRHSDTALGPRISRSRKRDPAPDRDQEPTPGSSRSGWRRCRDSSAQRTSPLR